MCITVKTNYPKQSNGSIRYKVVILKDGKFISPFYNDNEFTLNEPANQELPYYKDWDINSHGYHVFVHLWEAKRFMGRKKNATILICECEDFIAGGTWIGTVEIWKSIKPIEVYSFWREVGKFFKRVGNIWKI